MYVMGIKKGNLSTPKKREPKSLGIHISSMSSQVAPNHRCKCAIYYSSKAKVKNKNKT